MRAFTWAFSGLAGGTVWGCGSNDDAVEAILLYGESHRGQGHRL